MQKRRSFKKAVALTLATTLSVSTVAFAAPVVPEIVFLKTTNGNFRYHFSEVSKNTSVWNHFFERFQTIAKPSGSGNNIIFSIAGDDGRLMIFDPRESINSNEQSYITTQEQFEELLSGDFAPVEADESGKLVVGPERPGTEDVEFIPEDGDGDADGDADGDSDVDLSDYVMIGDNYTSISVESAASLDNVEVKIYLDNADVADLAIDTTDTNVTDWFKVDGGEIEDVIEGFSAEVVSNEDGVITIALTGTATEVAEEVSEDILVTIPAALATPTTTTDINAGSIEFTVTANPIDLSDYVTLGATTLSVESGSVLDNIEVTINLDTEDVADLAIDTTDSDVTDWFKVDGGEIEDVIEGFSATVVSNEDNVITISLTGTATEVDEESIEDILVAIPATLATPSTTIDINVGSIEFTVIPVSQLRKDFGIIKTDHVSDFGMTFITVEFYPGLGNIVSDMIMIHNDEAVSYEVSKFNSDEFTFTIQGGSASDFLPDDVIEELINNIEVTFKSVDEVISEVRLTNIPSMSYPINVIFTNPDYITGVSVTVGGISITTPGFREDILEGNLGDEFDLGDELIVTVSYGSKMVFEFSVPVE